MIFLRYESLREYIRLYPISTLLLAVNIFVFLLLSLSGGSTNTDTLIKFGALVNLPPFDGEIWRYVTSMFLHIGFSHLLFNGFAIYIFGPPLEKMLGSAKYLLFYLGSGIIGNLTSVLLMSRLTVSAGASGAIYGIFGAYIFMVLYKKQMLDIQSRKTITVIIVIGVIYTLINPVVNIYAHFGGFIGGVILYSLFDKVK